jgi:dephospho-CoA kinase
MLTAKVIAVCGQIGSGKSSIIGELSKTYGWNTVSFGAYIKSRIAADHPTRTDYQSLGEMLFATRGPKGLLEDAIRFGEPRSSTFLIDGVRHVSIVTELRRIYGEVVIIFLDVSDSQRYERFTRRNDTDPPMSYDDFVQMCSHPIEQGILDLAKIADVVIDGNVDFEGVLTAILSHLNKDSSASVPRPNA